jgi:tRNA(Ile)-lysidine synthase
VNAGESGTSTDRLEAVLERAAAELPEHAGYCVAYSAGPDSTALLHALTRSFPGRVRALHVDHGLQTAAAAWGELARCFCEALGVALDVLPVRVRQTGQGIEAAARYARYAAFEAALRPGEVLVTAHHAEDQAETVLLRLLRGTGIDGAAAIVPLRRLGAGWLWRPLLRTERAVLLQHVQAHALPHVSDPHNANPRFARSRLRQTLMPAIVEAHPSAVESLGRFAENARAFTQVLNQYLDADLAAMRKGEGISLQSLAGLDVQRRHLILRRHLQQHGLPAPDAAWLDRFDAELLAASVDRHPVLAIADARVCRHDGALLLRRPLAAVPEAWETRWDGAAPLMLPGDGGTLASDRRFPGLAQVRFCVGGERLRPEGGAQHRQLRNLFQEARVPLWLRRRTPVLLVQGNVAQIGIWRGHLAEALLGGARVTWTPPEWLLGPAPGSAPA